MYRFVSFIPISFRSWSPANLFPSSAAQGHALFMHCAYLEKASSLPFSGSLWITHKSAGLLRTALTQALQRLFTGHSLTNCNPGMCWECSCWKGHVRSEQLLKLCSQGAAVAQDTQPLPQWIIRVCLNTQTFLPLFLGCTFCPLPPIYYRILPVVC